MTTRSSRCVCVLSFKSMSFVSFLVFLLYLLFFTDQFHSCTTSCTMTLQCTTTNSHFVVSKLPSKWGRQGQWGGQQRQWGGRAQDAVVSRALVCFFLCFLSTDDLSPRLPQNRNGTRREWGSWKHKQQNSILSFVPQVIFLLMIQ